MISTIRKSQYGFIMISILTTLLILVIHCWNIGNLYTIYMSEDELGYIGNAAYFAGHDWSEVMHYSPYYGYGYSLFLAPLFWLRLSPVCLYRAFIVLNACFMVGTCWLAYGIGRRLYPELNRYVVLTAAFCVSVYSGFTTQSSIAWAECCIVFVTWLVLYLALQLSSRITYYNIMLLTSASWLLYMSHQRNVAMTVVVSIYLFVMLRKNNKDGTYYGTYFLTFLLFGGAHVYIKNRLKTALYTSDNLGNDYASILRRLNIGGDLLSLLNSQHRISIFICGVIVITIAIIIVVLFRKKTIRAITRRGQATVAGVIIIGVGVLCFGKESISIAREIFGQWYYLGAASFLVGYIGFIVSIRAVQCDVKKRMFFILAIFCMLGSLLISSISLRNADGRIEYAFYGRYIESIWSFFLFIGLLKPWQRNKEQNAYKSDVIIAIGMFAISAVVLHRSIIVRGLMGKPYQPSCAVGLYWMFQKFQENIAIISIVVLSGFGLIVGMCRIFEKKDVGKYVSVILLSLVFVMQGKHVVSKAVEPYHANTKVIVNEFDGLLEKNSSIPIIYCADSVGKKADYSDHRAIYQMLQYQKAMQCVVGETMTDEASTENSILILENMEQLPVMFNSDDYVMLTSNAFNSLMVYRGKLYDELLNKAGDRFQTGDLLASEFSSQNRGAGNVLCSNGEGGYLVYGNYRSMLKGNYVLSIDLDTSGCENSECGYVDVAANYGQDILQQQVIQKGVDHMEIPFTIERYLTGVELRVWINEKNFVEITKMQIENYKLE